MTSGATDRRKLQALGLAIFPTNGKIPATPNGVHDASAETDWTIAPGQGIALATGEPSGVWALDLDGPEGVAAIVRLQEEHGQLPRTITSRTRNGYHLLFRMPETGDVRNSAGKVAAGIDVRGTGGYIVVPPSPHPDGGTYAWMDGRSPDDIRAAAAPGWLLKLVRPSERTFSAPKAVPSEPHGDRYIRAAIESECSEVARTPEGQRNHRLNAAAFSLARFVAAGQAAPEPIVRELAYAAAQAGLPEWEIQRTVASAFKARGAL